jgi:4-amino-4-deoxy-L-arabinose transferase-like glycosyltransferase
MLYVSLIVELLRARPSLLFWTAALSQAALWLAVPTLFYSAPPGDLPQTIAVGREFLLGTQFGPPLAFWLAELAWRWFGAFGVYLLSQICIVVAYWAVVALGRGVVGPKHGVIAILLMVGIAAFTVPTPEFGPSVLAAPIWSLALLSYWRAVHEKRRRSWFILAVWSGLLLLTTYLGLILLGLLVLLTLVTPQGRAALRTADPWIWIIVVFIVVFPHLAWLERTRDLWQRLTANIGSPDLNTLAVWGRLLAGLVVAHLGALVLIALASWPFGRTAPAPAIDREPTDMRAASFVLYCALVPLLAASLYAAASNWTPSLIHATPLLVLSGLAVVVAAGEEIRLQYERIVSFAWLGLLIGPPILMVVGLLVLPWTIAIDLPVAQPARTMGLFFAESYQRRTGRPLQIVTGEARFAALIAAEAPSRPSVYFLHAPAQSPWLTRADIVQKGAVIVWPATDTAGTPPPAVRDAFPDIVPEVPRAFSRAVQGRLPLLRVGWAVVRPQD